MIDTLTEIHERFEQKVYVLGRNTSAIETISDLDGKTRLGMIVQLPEGAEVRVCGAGFNERTVKVAWEGGFYYIFLEDIERDAVTTNPFQALAMAFNSAYPDLPDSNIEEQGALARKSSGAASSSS